MHTPNTPRPKRTDEPVVKAAVQIILPEVLAWLKRNDDEANTPEEIAASLEKAAKWNIADGYELAKALDHAGWAPDAELVETLDNYSCGLSRALDSATEAWLPTSGLTAHAIGAWVKCPRSPYPGHIVRVDEQHGKATVCIPALGHSPDPGPKGGRIGFVIEWESLTPAEEGGAK